MVVLIVLLLGSLPAADRVAAGRSGEHAEAAAPTRFAATSVERAGHCWTCWRVVLSGCFRLAVLAFAFTTRRLS
jgi:hypothetical protein